MSDSQFLNAKMNISQAPQGQMQSHQVSAFANEQAQRASTNSAKLYSGLAEQAIKMNDYRKRVDSLESMSNIKNQSEEEADHALSVAPGHPDSWKYEDGTINQEKVDEYMNRYAEEYKAVAPSFSTRDQDIAWEGERNDYIGNSLKRLVGKAVSSELQSIRRSSNAIIEEAMQAGDFGTVAAEAERQVAAGILSEQEGRNMRTKAAKSFARRTMTKRLSTAETARQNTLDMYASLKPDLGGTTEPAGTDTPAEPPSAPASESAPVSAGTPAESSEDTPTEPAEGAPAAAPAAEPAAEQSTSTLLGEGVSYLSMDDFSQMMAASNAASSVSTMNDDGSFNVSETAPQIMQDACHEANACHGMTRAKWREMATIIAADLCTSAHTKNYSDAELRSLIETQVKIKGIEDIVADGNSMHLDNELAGIINNVLSVRGGTLKDKDRAMVGADGLEGINSMVETMFNDDQWAEGWEDSRHAFAETDADWSILGSLSGRNDKHWTPQHAKLKKKWEIHRAQYAADTGDDDDDINVEEFASWYFSKDKPWEQARARFIRERKEYARAKALQAVADLRLKGEPSWGAEQRVARDVIRQAQRDYSFDTQSGVDMESYYQKRNEALRAQAKAAHDRATPELLKIEEMNRQIAEQEAAMKAAKKAQDDTKKDAERAEAKKVKEDAEQAERARNPYRYPVSQNIQWDGDRSGSSKQGIVTVPMKQYVDICQQLDIPINGGNGVVARVGRGSTTYLVQPANVQRVQVNDVLFRKLTPPNVTGAALKRRLEGFEATLTFGKF